MQTNYFNNPSALKIDLMLKGIRIADGLQISPFGGRAGIGVDIVLPNSTLVNVPCGEEFTINSPYLLKKGKKDYVISDGANEVSVEVVETPLFYDGKTTTGVKFSDIASVHGNLVVITPLLLCEFFTSDVECRYCAGNFNKDANPHPALPHKGGGDKEAGDSMAFSVEEVLETVGAVTKEMSGKIIYLSIGFSDGDDGGIAFLAPYIKEIKKHFNCLIAVEALPPKNNAWIDETYAQGADSILYNLEIFDKELFELVCPGRAEKIGRQRYIEALKYASGVFPNGTVASHLIVGLEPPGSTRMGIDFLTDMGVVPILPIYRPQPGRALRIEPLTAEVIIPIYKHLYKAVKKNSINMNWVRDISSVTTPIEGRFLAGEDKTVLHALEELFYKSGLGLKAAWGLSAIRRKLRVKDEQRESR